MMHRHLLTVTLTLRTLGSRCGPRGGLPHTTRVRVKSMCADKGMAHYQHYHHYQSYLYTNFTSVRQTYPITFILSLTLRKSFSIHLSREDAKFGHCMPIDGPIPCKYPHVSTASMEVFGDPLSHMNVPASSTKNTELEIGWLE